MILTEATEHQRFERMVNQIIASADALNDVAAAQVLTEVAKLQARVVREITSAAMGSFHAAALAKTRRALATAVGAFVTDYEARYPLLAAKAWELGLDLADRPFAAAGVPVPSGIVARSVLETMTRYSADLIQGVGADAISAVNAVITQATLGTLSATDAIAQVAGSLPGRSVFPSLTARAETIVRTEVGRTFSIAHEARFQQMADAVPGLEKQWLTAQDSRVRDTHAEAAGQTIGPGEFFYVGGYEARYPRDPRLPAEESINCRCYAIPVVPADLLQGASA